MKSIIIELKKYKHTYILEIMPFVGVLGALYSFANFLFRKDSLLSLPLHPMDILLTQLYGVIMMLNMFGIIIITTAAYNLEFHNHAIKNFYLLPFKISHIFRNKFFILLFFVAICALLQDISLYIIGFKYLPANTFEPFTLINYSIYCFFSTLPVFSFMLMISSILENIWLTLGVGVIGFFSGMTMSISKFNIFLINPFVLMIRPSVDYSADINILILIISIVETFIFFFSGYFLSMNKKI